MTVTLAEGWWRGGAPSSFRDKLLFLPCASCRHLLKYFHVILSPRLYHDWLHLQSLVLRKVLYTINLVKSSRSFPRFGKIESGGGGQR